MSTNLPWDKSRMEWKPVDMTVMYHGDGGFTASTKSGEIEFLMEAPIGISQHSFSLIPIIFNTIDMILTLGKVCSKCVE